MDEFTRMVLCGNRLSLRERLLHPIRSLQHAAKCRRLIAEFNRSKNVRWQSRLVVMTQEEIAADPIFNSELARQREGKA